MSKYNGFNLSDNDNNPFNPEQDRLTKLVDNLIKCGAITTEESKRINVQGIISNYNSMNTNEINNEKNDTNNNDVEDNDDVITPQGIYNELSKFVIGQHEAKRDLSILGYNHYMRFKHNALVNGNYDHNLVLKAGPPKLSGLITGPTGTGKTLLVQTLCHYLHLPFLQIDASSLQPTGNDAGNGLKDYFKSYLSECTNNYSIDYADYGIVYLDEVDKLFEAMPEGHNSKYNQNTRSELLTLIDGTHVIHNITARGFNFETKNLLIIMSGAYEYIYKQRDGKNDIGFQAEHNPREDRFNKAIQRKELQDNSLMTPEILGRISIVTHTQRLNRSEIRQVIMECQNSIYDQYHSLFILNGDSKPLFTPEQLDNIIDIIYNNDYGMRTIKTILYDQLKDRIWGIGNYHYPTKPSTTHDA